MLVAPNVLLLALLTAVIAIGVVSRLAERRRSRQLADVARRSGWTYSRTDRFGLAERVAGNLDVPGVADLHVEDVCYRTWPCGTWFVFTVSYVVGAIRSRRRVTRLAGWLESHGQCGAVALESRQLLENAKHAPPRPDQYARLIEELTAAASSRQAGSPGSPTQGPWPRK